jgi:predicted lipid-binding transport protein (Tim44 family)
VLLTLSACASVPEQSAAPLDKQEVVARMAQLRWDAMVKGDFEVAYKMLSPASRAIVTLSEFQRKAGVATWKAANVRKVECSADDLCTVSVEGRYAVKLRNAGRTVENDQAFSEMWRFTAGNWWYVLNAP